MPVGSRRPVFHMALVVFDGWACAAEIRHPIVYPWLPQDVGRCHDDMLRVTLDWRREHTRIPQLVLLTEVAGGDEGMANLAGDQFLENSQTAFCSLVDTEAHPRLLRATDEAQQIPVHTKGSADLQNGRADGLIRLSNASVVESPEVEIGVGQRTHGRPARHVEVLRF